MITWNDVIKFASKGNPEPERRVEKSDHEWKDLLTVEQYKITRLKGTEPAGTGALCHAHEAGVYSCYAAILNYSIPPSNLNQDQDGPALPNLLILPQ